VTSELGEQREVDARGLDEAGGSAGFCNETVCLLKVAVGLSSGERVAEEEVDGGCVASGHSVNARRCLGGVTTKVVGLLEERDSATGEGSLCGGRNTGKACTDDGDMATGRRDVARSDDGGSGFRRGAGLLVAGEEGAEEWRETWGNDVAARKQRCKRDHQGQKQEDPRSPHWICDGSFIGLTWSNDQD
jgi:hypothetical protein